MKMPSRKNRSTKSEKRSANYSASEISSLLEIISEFEDYLSIKKNDIESNRKKSESWKIITQLFNERNHSYQRSEYSLRLKYNSLKSAKAIQKRRESAAALESLQALQALYTDNENSLQSDTTCSPEKTDIANREIKSEDATEDSQDITSESTEEQECAAKENYNDTNSTKSTVIINAQAMDPCPDPVNLVSSSSIPNQDSIKEKQTSQLQTNENNLISLAEKKANKIKYWEIEMKLLNENMKYTKKNYRFKINRLKLKLKMLDLKINCLKESRSLNMSYSSDSE